MGSKKKTVAKAYFLGNQEIKPGSKVELPPNTRIVILQRKIHKWDRWHYPDERLALPTREAKTYVKNGYGTWAQGVFKAEKPAAGSGDAPPESTDE